MLPKKNSNNHIFSLAGNVISAALGVCVYSLLAHNLATKAEFGNYVIFVITLALADIFRTGFLQNSLVKFYSGINLDRAIHIVGSTWFIGLFITLIVCLVNVAAYFFYYDVKDPGLDTIIAWFGITFISTLPSSVAVWILQAEERFKNILYIRLINQGFYFVFVAALILFNKLTLGTAIYANLVSCLVASIYTMLMGWAQLKNLRHRNRESTLELFHYGKFSVGTAIAANLLRSSDVYMIKFTMGAASAAAVGVYNLPQKLMEIIEIPIRSFTSSVMPIISTAANREDDEKVAYVMKKYAGMLTLALLPVSLVGLIGADLFIQLIAGNKFAGSEAGTIFRIFMCFAMLLPIDRFFGITLDMINRPRVNMIKVFIMLAVNITGDAISLLVFHSLVGVAVVSIFTFASGVIYGYLRLKSYLNFTMNDILVLGHREIISTLRKKLKLETA